MKKLLPILFVFIAATSIAQVKRIPPDPNKSVNTLPEDIKVRTRILFLFDASNSMYAKLDNDNRINSAKKVLTRIIDSLRYQQSVELALRVFGHRSPTSMRDCKDTKLEVPFEKGNHTKITDFIKSIRPKGTTPIAYSLQQSAEDFPIEAGVRNIIVLITDGLEECDGDPCTVSEALQRKGIILKPFIIGIGGNDLFKKAFDCVGRYYDANTEESLQNVLNVVVSQAINATTAQVNLLDIFGKPTETNVGMTFYDSYTGRVLYNYEHTINERGNPDTLVLDPAYHYNLVVHTVPELTKNNIEVTAGKHTNIGLDAPQGDLLLRIDGVTSYANLQVIVRQLGQMKTVNIQSFNTSKKYLVGKYDLEILSYPRIYMREVSIDQSATTTINIPQPGKLSIQSDKDVYGDIYYWNNNKLDWVIGLPLGIRREVYTLQPGTYKVVYRSKISTKAVYTFERDFTITSGGGTNIGL
ncbi:MAG: VWA domain-containing protein [Bacteroidetes bacterium]|nr:VWA domain-containing protein [Bacteroidota bacterium]